MIARLLGKDLEGQGFKVWFDSNEIEPSEDWVTEIERGIDSSTVIVVIWTENAANSEWVNREISRADQKNKPVIPLKFDNAETRILLQRTQHIDFSNGYYGAFPQLTSYLMRYVDSEEQTKSVQNVASWAYQKSPFFRNRFLEENNYRNRKDTDFALNERTNTLFNRRTEAKAEAFVTIITIPTPESVDVDLAQLSKILDVENSPRTVRMENAQAPWQRFSFSSLQDKENSQNELMWFHSSGQSRNPHMYIRFEEDGAIEYATGNLVWNFNDINSFDFIGILGTTWKLLGLASEAYSRLNYKDQIQLIVNLKNTKNTTLANFAKDRRTGKQWISLSDSSHHATILRERNQGLTHNSNLQFVYNVNLSNFQKNVELSEDLIKDLSEKLQRSFNYQIEPRHYVPDSNEFPWYQFEAYNEI